MTDVQKKRYEEARVLREKNEYYLPDFRPDAPYAVDYQNYVENLKKFGGDPQAMRIFAADILDAYYTGEKNENHPDYFVPECRPEEYCKTNQVHMPRSQTEMEYVTYPSRSVHTIAGYKALEGPPELDRWGGLMEESYDSTGYFHVINNGRRFVIVDPDGHPYYNVGLCKVDVEVCTSQRVLENTLKKFGSMENWAEKTVQRLRELGITCGSRTSDTKRLVKTPTTFAVCGSANFLSSFARKRNAGQHGVGHMLFNDNNTMPVFMPEFETYADSYAAEVAAPYRDCNRILGWFSDNELPAQYNMLERFLTIDPTSDNGHYSLAVAWEYLKRETGLDNPTLNDITEEIRERFRGVVYDRYFRIVRTALKKYVPNHMYIGCRFSYVGKLYQDGKTMSATIMDAAGRWCDIITVNYYMAWTPDAELMLEWQKWAGRPFMVTEWYAMAYDSGLACMTGAGFRVRTQQDRADFYQNFALWLLECPWFTGFHWFMYMDNDPGDPNAEVSNMNSNKGIITSNFEEWTTLTGAMKELNDNIYPLIRFFDARNGIGR